MGFEQETSINERKNSVVKSCAHWLAFIEGLYNPCEFLLRHVSLDNPFARLASVCC
jgi:hypothetical protein